MQFFFFNLLEAEAKAGSSGNRSLINAGITASLLYFEESSSADFDTVLLFCFKVFFSAGQQHGGDL